MIMYIKKLTKFRVINKIQSCLPMLRLQSGLYLGSKLHNKRHICNFFSKNPQMTHFNITFMVAERVKFPTVFYDS